jgi:nucleoside 2-deoxyribosyltransferase
MGAHPSVFLSFGWDDRDLADQLTQTLHDAGISVRRTETELRAGDRWADAVTSAIRDFDLILFIAPLEGEAGSNNAFFELGVAGALRKPVVPVVKDARDAANLAKMHVPSFLADRQWLSARDLPDLVDEVRTALRQVPVS